MIGPMCIPSATNGHENLFVALANRNRVCAPKMEYLTSILAQQSPKKWKRYLLLAASLTPWDIKLSFLKT